jgi:alkanesulfonate monooxygenase SsuD/methylene tetrahydromethanopterin reductase-like flavin-dependent oxidoreductase (luciferase family)
LIGGGGEKKTLRLVARYADACNLFGSSPADVAHKLDVLREHCNKESRDYDTVDKTVLLTGRSVLDETDAMPAQVQRYAALGVSEVQVMPDRHPVDFAEQLVQRVLPRLTSIG